MTIFLLFLIVAILLFGAAFVRGALLYIILIVAGITALVPLAFWLKNYPETFWIAVLVLLGSLIGIRFWISAADDKEKMAHWAVFAESINNDFDDQECQEVTLLWQSGQMNRFAARCRQLQGESKREPDPERRARRRALKERIQASRR